MKFFFVDFSMEDNMVDIWNEWFLFLDNDFEFLEFLFVFWIIMFYIVVKLRYGKRNDVGDLMCLGWLYKDFVIYLEM